MINSSSSIIDVLYDYEEHKIHINYFESKFDDELDVYNFIGIYTEDIHGLDFTDYVNYQLYGKFWDEFSCDFLLVFGKQVDRIANTIKEEI